MEVQKAPFQEESRLSTGSVHYVSWWEGTKSMFDGNYLNLSCPKRIDLLTFDGLPSLVHSHGPQRFKLAWLQKLGKSIR